MDDPYVPPKDSDFSVQAVPTVLSFDRDSLVVPHEFTFPAMCVKTGAIENLAPQIVYRLYWYRSGLIMLLWPLPVLIPSLFPGIHCVFRFHVTNVVFIRERRCRFAQELLLYAAVALFTSLIFLSSDSGTVLISGILFGVICLVLSFHMRQLLQIHFADKNHIWLRGVSESVAQELVENNGMVSQEHISQFHAA